MYASSCHGHTPRRHILPRKEGGFSVYVSNILRHSLEILDLPISGFLGTLKSFVTYLISKAIGFSRYVAKLWSLHHIPAYRIF